LTSLLWRPRRATAIEPDLLQLQSDIIGALKRPDTAQQPTDRSASNEAFIWSDRSANCEANRNEPLSYLALTHNWTRQLNGAAEGSTAPTSELARCFLRLANLDGGAFERANRYEPGLWRQLGQVLLTLELLAADEMNETSAHRSSHCF
jgi:hypothetical protein